MTYTDLTKLVDTEQTPTVKDKMTLADKKRKRRKLRSLLNTAWSISNDLIGEEDSFSKNENSLQRIRQYIQLAQGNENLLNY